MSIVYPITEKYGTEQGEIGEKGKRSASRIFWVRTNSIYDKHITVRQATGIPRVGNYYASGNDLDTGLICTKVNPRQNAKNNMLWEVTCQYSSSYEDPDENEENPLDRPAKLSFRFADYTVILPKDLAGKAFENSAEQPFRNPPPILRSRVVFVVVKNQATVSVAQAIEYGNSVNSATWYGFPAGSLLMKPWQAHDAYENGVHYWEVTYEMQYDEDLWIPLKVLDTGHLYKDDAGNKVVAHEEGVYHGREVKLDGTGKKLAEGAASKWRDFTVYREKNFSALNLV